MKLISSLVFCSLFLATKVNAQQIIKYSERPNGHNSPYRIPISETLENPDVYEGTHLQVVGYLSINAKGVGVYSNNKDASKHRTKRGIWISKVDQIPLKCAKYKNHYITIDAIFDANNHGYMKGWGAGLKKITSIKLYKAGD